MSVTVRPYVNGGWEVDIRVQLPDGRVVRERKKTSASSKLAAQKWAEARERVLLVHGKPKPVEKEAIPQIPMMRDFAVRFLDGYAKANRLKPSGIASKEGVIRVHLVKAFGDTRLDEVTTEDVQRLKPSQWSDEAIATIRAWRPDIIWLALGAPKQEMWMRQYAVARSRPRS